MKIEAPYSVLRFPEETGNPGDRLQRGGGRGEQRATANPAATTATAAEKGRERELHRSKRLTWAFEASELRPRLSHQKAARLRHDHLLGLLNRRRVHEAGLF